MDDLYDRIEKLGKEIGCDNMTVLCRAANVPRAVMSELKSGRTNELSLKNAVKFAEIFDISVEELFGTGKKRPVTEDDELNAYLEELRTRPEMRMLFKLSKGATKEDVEQAVKIIEALQKK